MAQEYPRGVRRPRQAVRPVCEAPAATMRPVGDERLIAMVDANLAGVRAGTSRARPRRVARGARRHAPHRRRRPAPSSSTRRSRRAAADPASILPAAAAFFGRLGHGTASGRAPTPTRPSRRSCRRPASPRHRPAGHGPRGAPGRRSGAGRGSSIRQVVDEAGVEDFRVADRAGFADDDQEPRRAVRFGLPRSGQPASIRRWPGSWPTSTASRPRRRCRSRRSTWRVSAGSGPCRRSVGAGSGSAVTRAAVLAGFDRRREPGRPRVIARGRCRSTGRWASGRSRRYRVWSIG